MAFSERQVSRFFSNIRVLENGCWEWILGVGPQGYVASLWHVHYGDSVIVEAMHRAAYRHWNGGLPSGMTVDHACHTRAVINRACPGGTSCPHRRCVNPEHLEAVSAEENTRRGVRSTITHCPSGHDFTPENTVMNSRAVRECRTCRAGWNKAYLEKKLGRKLLPPHASRTHCPKGHEYDPANTYVNPQGSRNCRACTRAAGIAYRLKKKGLPA